MKFLAVLMLLLMGCQTREIGEPSASKRTLVFSDNFDRVELGNDWKRGVGEAGNGKWAIQDGWLTGSALKNDPLWLTKSLPDRVRVEFDAQALTPEGDLKFEIFGDGNQHASGYVVIMGGWKNSLDVIARLDEHGADRLAQPSLKVVPNRTYKMAAERDGRALRWYVDDKLVMTYDDAQPLVGREHAFFAFNDWNAPVRFDNLRVFELQ
ncbi:MAG: hypothetical protein R3E66_21685 [bacterium]